MPSVASANRLGEEHAAPRRVLRLLCLAALAFAISVATARAAAPRAVFALEALGQSDHRGYFVLDARPGATITRAIGVVNTGQRAGAVRLYGVDATTGQTTGAVYRAARDPRRDAGAWIRLAERRLRLAPGQSRTVRFTITVPRLAGPGAHLGAVVAENTAVMRGPTRRRGANSFRVDVRSLAIIAVQLNLPGPRRERLALSGVQVGAAGRQQALLVGLRNDGNQLIKGTGQLNVHDEHGVPVKHMPFSVDTFVPRTQVADPVPVPGAALPAGSYEAAVTVRYGHGKVTRLNTTFTISHKQIEQVFGSSPQQPASSRTSGPPLVALIGGALALLAVGFAAALLFVRRREPKHPAAS